MHKLGKQFVQPSLRLHSDFANAIFSLIMPCLSTQLPLHRLGFSVTSGLISACGFCASSLISKFAFEIAQPKAQYSSMARDMWAKLLIENRRTKIVPFSNSVMSWTASRCRAGNNADIVSDALLLMYMNSQLTPTMLRIYSLIMFTLGHVRNHHSNLYQFGRFPCGDII
jgi:hypothetical protein